MLVLPATVTLEVARDVLAMLTPALAREPDDQAVVDASVWCISIRLRCRCCSSAAVRRWPRPEALRSAAPCRGSCNLARLYGVSELLDGTATAAQGVPA